MKMFFDAHAALEMQLNTEAVQLYNDILNSGFQKSSYVLSQMAVAQYNIRGKILSTNWRKFVDQVSVVLRKTVSKGYIP